MFRKALVLGEDAESVQRYQRMLCAAGFDAQWRDWGTDQAPGSAELDADVIFVLLTSADSNPVAALRWLKASQGTVPVVVVSRNRTVETAVEAMRAGAADYLFEPCSAEELGAALSRLEPSLSAAAPAGLALSESEALRDFEGMLGRCSAMRDVFALLERIAPAEATVLVTGESGTGKEMVVRAIHRLSRRRDAPLLGCDCTALAPTLLESELFGHVKGSFSGAIATKKGLFEAADHGTLLLDEVSNLSLETQGKLLRVLETRCIRRVGDTAEHDVDIRLIATTNRNLGEMVKAGSFRADLYYRLNVVPVTLPPLRERSGDIRLLATAFLEHFSHQMALESTVLSPQAMQQMEIYPWPGNVRELRNIVQRLAVLYGGTQIEVSHLPIEVREARHTVSSTELPRTWDEFKSFKRQIIEDLERRFLAAALDRCEQNVTHAAESVGMQRPNFHALLRQHGLKPPRG
jgi:DNA-binding NtrC family response regulator